MFAVIQSFGWLYIDVIPGANCVAQFFNITFEILFVLTAFDVFMFDKSFSKFWKWMFVFFLEKWQTTFQSHW